MAKQITDEEKLIIATLQSAVNIHNGIYPFSDLVKILAQNVTSFTKRYTPYEHPRIMQYLKTRSKRQVILPAFSNPTPKGGQGKAKGIKVQKTNQRLWTYLQEPETGLVSPGQYQPKGKTKTRAKARAKVNLKARVRPHRRVRQRVNRRGQGHKLRKEERKVAAERHFLPWNSFVSV